jgi:hypothetical protein
MSMSDHSEPDNARPSRLVADQAEAGGDRGPLPRPTNVSPGRSTKGDAIKAVSDLLTRKKPAFEPIPNPGATQLPKFPRPLESTILELKKSPGLRAKPGPSPTSMEPPPVELPEGGRLAKTSASEPASSEFPSSGTPGPTLGIDPPEPVSVTSKSVGSGLEGTVPPPDRRGPRSGPDSSTMRVREGQWAPGASIGPGESVPPIVEKADVRIMHRDPRQIGGPGHPGDLPGSPESPAAAAIDLSRAARPATGSDTAQGNGAEAIQPGVTASRSGLAAGAGTIPATRAEGSSVAVRNPLASGMGHFSTAPQDLPGPGAQGAGLEATGAGAGSGSTSFGGASMSQRGESTDLSKTNDLLRQLVDAVKKQRDASLPVGGQSVYPGR